MYFDVCAAIAENTGPWSNCGGLSWERTYRLNDKCICPEEDSGTSSCVYYEQLYCSYWGCERWATWLKEEAIPNTELPLFYRKGKQPLTALLVPVTL
jgi:hypothetical protein